MQTVFQSYPVTVKVSFTCTGCKKPKRTRSFREECTLSPFNTEAHTPAEVRQQSKRRAQAKAIRHMREPLCSACEKALDYSAHQEWRKRTETVDAAP